MHALTSSLAFSLYIAVCGSIDPPQEMESKRILETARNAPKTCTSTSLITPGAAGSLCYFCCIRSTPLGQAFGTTYTTCTVHRYYLR
jgi:hypothetical protein